MMSRTMPYGGCRLADFQRKEWCRRGSVTSCTMDLRTSTSSLRNSRNSIDRPDNRRMFLVKWLSVVVFASAIVCMAQAQGAAPDAPSEVAQPRASQPNFDSARRLMQLGKFDEAIGELQQIQSGNPAAKGLDHEFGTAYYKKGEYIRAIEYLKKAI